MPNNATKRHRVSRRLLDFGGVFLGAYPRKIGPLYHYSKSATICGGENASF